MSDPVPTTTIDRIDRSVGRAIDWLQTMLPAPDGSRGIWERIRIDIDEVVHWVRPDCTAEARALFADAAVTLQRPELGPVADGMGTWLLSAQNEDGSFPFYQLAEPDRPSTLGQTGATRYPNDNGKVLEMLSLWPDATDGADRLAHHLADNQDEQGGFPMNWGPRLGPCFVAWPAIGLARHAALGTAGAEASRQAALRSIDRLVELQLPDGRLQTSYEIQGRENWRPASSETAETLRAFSLAQRLLGVDLGEQIAGAADFLHRLSTEEGAIRNCDDSCRDASEQNDASLTDLVYTCGYALHAWIDAWRATGDLRHLEAGHRLGEFLMSIQVDDPHVGWHGAWRGSYDVDRRTWRGRANQSNPIDEGGAWSVYTGWTTATIATGLLRLRAAVTTGHLDPS